VSILVILEQHDGRWNRISWETLAAGQELGQSLGMPVVAALAGARLGDLSAEAASKEVDKIWAVEHELLKDYTADGYTAAYEALIRRIKPAIVLFPHSYRVRDFAPKLATRFSQTLVSDVVEIRVEAASPRFVRQLFQGRLKTEVSVGGDGPSFVSLQAGAWRADRVQTGAAPAGIETFAPALDPSQIRQKPETPFREAARAVDLTAADIIVAVGRGIKEKENIPMAEELAKALGAELAASRPICDAGWLPMERQVGSSGQTVEPKLYIAIGISGAIQHLVGMKGAKTIVAINKDADAPIFEIADYGIAGDLFELVPALTEEVKKLRQ